MEGDNEGMYLHVLSYSPQNISTGHLGRMLPYKVSDQVGYENITFTNSETNLFQSTTTCNCFTICWFCVYSIMFHFSAAGPVIYHVFFLFSTQSDAILRNYYASCCPFHCSTNISDRLSKLKTLNTPLTLLPNAFTSNGLKRGEIHYNICTFLQQYFLP